MAASALINRWDRRALVRRGDTLIDEVLRVVVPWIVERTRASQQREGLDWLQADLFDHDAVANVVAVSAGMSLSPATRIGHLVGGLRLRSGSMRRPRRSNASCRLNLRPPICHPAALRYRPDRCGALDSCASDRARLQPSQGRRLRRRLEGAVISFAQRPCRRIATSS